MSDGTETASPQAETLEPASGGLDAIISSAIEKTGYGSDDEPVTDASADATQQDTTGATDDRQRDSQGRFLPKDSAEAKPSQEEPATAEATAPTQAAEPAPDVQPLEPPARWSEAEKAEFAKLPREAQAVLAERYKAMEADYTRKTQEIAETRKAVEPLIQEVGKWSPYLRQLGVTPDQAFTQMLTTEYTLRTGTPEQKVQSLAYLAQLYGVPLPNQTAGDGTQPDPAFTQLHQQVSQLQQQLRQMNEQSVLSERQRAQAEFDALGQTKDESGQPKFPHFQRVSQTMIQLVSTGQAETWEAAYAKSVRLDDELYRQTMEAERQSVAAETEKRRLEAVEKAKKVSPVKSSDGSPKGAAQPKGLDAHLSGALERAGIA